jgi:uncharacterized membrane protein
MSHGSDPPRYLDFIPTDLVLIGLLGVWTVAAGAGVAAAFPGRTVVGLVAVLFAPGYALVAALFPRTNDGPGLFERLETTVGTEGNSVTVVERLLLAVALSVCLVPLVGLGVTFATLRIETVTFLGAVGLTTISLTVVAALRRRETLPWERFNPRVTDLTAGPARLGSLPGRPAVTFLLVVGFVVAAGGMGLAVLDADRGEQFTEFGLLTEDPATGELVADDYPDQLTPNATERVYVSITNNEGHTVEYSVVTILQSFGPDGQQQQAELLDQETVVVQQGETARTQQSLRPEITGENLRVTYLLYIGSPPREGRPSADNAYRRLHHWVDVPATPSPSVTRRRSPDQR